MTNKLTTLSHTCLHLHLHIWIHLLALAHPSIFGPAVWYYIALYCALYAGWFGLKVKVPVITVEVCSVDTWQLIKYDQRASLIIHASYSMLRVCVSVMFTVFL